MQVSKKYAVQDFFFLVSSTDPFHVRVGLNRSMLSQSNFFTRIMVLSGLKWFRSNRFLECRLLFSLEDAQMLLLFKATVIKDERQKSEKRDLFFFWSAVRGGAGGAGGAGARALRKTLPGFSAATNWRKSGRTCRARLEQTQRRTQKSLILLGCFCAALLWHTSTQCKESLTEKGPYSCQRKSIFERKRERERSNVHVVFFLNTCKTLNSQLTLYQL